MASFPLPIDCKYDPKFGDVMKRNPVGTSTFPVVGWLHVGQSALKFFPKWLG